MADTSTGPTREQLERWSAIATRNMETALKEMEGPNQGPVGRRDCAATAEHLVVLLQYTELMLSKSDTPSGE